MAIMTRNRGMDKGAVPRWVMTAAFFFFSWAGAWAQEKDAMMPKHMWETGLGVGHLDYEEEIYGLEVEISGVMYEIFGRYTYRDEIMVRADLAYAVGDLEYDGFTQLGFPIEDDTEDWILECRLLLGYDFSFEGNHRVTPYLGAGYRYWNDDIQGSGGFERQIAYWYSPLGVETVSPLGAHWTWGVGLEYDLFWKGEVDTDLKRFPTLDQDSGYGVRFSVRFSKDFGDQYALSIEPYLTYWDMDASDREIWAFNGFEDVVFEPENETTSYGLRIGLAF
jgi:hypothetical protein